MNLRETIAGDVAARVDEMVDVRRTLHLEPELSFEEVGTTTLVRDRLAESGVALVSCPTATGAVGVLAGGRPGATVMLRADIDALPVEEASGLPYSSRLQGRMHACGHDAHTAVLLGVAATLAAHAESLPGNYVFTFQPAEERISGAQAMVDGGLLDTHRPDAVIGLHVFSGAPTGVVATKAGVAMAGARGLRIVVTGRGGHGALQPRQGNVVLAASRIADRLECVVAGMSSEGAPCICSPGMISAGSAPNVVPTRAEIHATLRWYDEAQREEAMTRLASLNSEIAADFEVEATVEETFATGPVRNDDAITGRVLQVAAEVLQGASVVRLASPLAASDDVSVFLDRVPGCYLMVGAGRADGTSGPHHCPTFAIDEGAMRVGATALAAGAVFLAQGEGAPATSGG